VPACHMRKVISMGFITRLFTIASCVLFASVACRAAGAAPVQFEVRLTTPASARVAMPVTISGPAVPLLRALGLSGDPAGYQLRVHEGATEIPAQWDAHEGKVACSWIAPQKTERERAFRLTVEPAKKDAAAGGVTVSETPETVTVDTGLLRVVHSKKDGGFPTSITFLPDGGTFQEFQLNDRVHSRALNRGYFLRNDPQPEVTVESAGPVQAVIRVRARYLDGEGKAPEAGTAATYRYIYYAGLPIFRVEADITQEKIAIWDELHFLEWHFKHDFFTRFALAEPKDEEPRVVEFTNTKKSTSSRGWGALLNDRITFALSAGHQLVYDGLSDYGRYIHGPWIYNWDTASRSFAATIYAGPSETTPQALAETVMPWVRGGQATASIRVPALEARLARAGAQVKPEDAAGRWLLQYAARSTRSLDSLGSALQLLAKIEARKPAPARSGAQVTIEELPDVKVATDGVLAIGFRREATGWALCSLYHVPTGHEFLDSLTTPPVIWQARLRRPDGKTIDTLAGGPASITVDRAGLPRRLVLRLSWPGELSPTASITLDAGTGLSRWRFSAAKPEGERALWEVDFPVLSGLGSREHPERDTAAVPRSWGQAFPNPTVTLSRHSVNYPSAGWTMQYALLYHGNSGLYLGVHDPRAYSKCFTMETLHDAAGGNLAWRVTHYVPDMGKPGQGWAAPYDAIVGTYTGDWYEGSRIYRRFAETTPWLSKGLLAKRKDVGTAIRPLAIWMLASGGPDTVVPQVKQFHEFFNVPMGVHWYNWHQIPFDDNYPHYFPTKPGFREGVAELKALGIAVMPYINGRLWDTDTADWPDAKPSSAMRADGENYVEEYGSKQKLAPMCPTTPLWQQKMKETVLRLVREEGVSGVYLDQITAARPALCYNPTHGHPLGGGYHWWSGYRKLLGDIRAELARTHPTAFLTSENNSEPWTDLLEGHLTWTPPLGDLVPMYGVVYGGYAYPFGRQMNRAALDDRNGAAIEFATQFLWGGQLAWLGNIILEPKYRPEAEYLRLLAQTRAQCIPYLAEGEMLKPPAIVTPVPEITGKTIWGPHTVVDTVPAVQAVAWRAVDGSVAFFLTNLSTEAQSFTWEIDFARHRLGKAAVITPLGAKEGTRVVGPRLRRKETLPGRGVLSLIARPVK